MIDSNELLCVEHLFVARNRLNILVMSLNPVLGDELGCLIPRIACRGNDSMGCRSCIYGYVRLYVDTVGESCEFQFSVL